MGSEKCRPDESRLDCGRPPANQATGLLVAVMLGVLMVAPLAAAPARRAVEGEVVPRAYLPSVVCGHRLDVQTAYVGGVAEAVAVDGDLIVVGNGPSVTVYESSAGDVPELIGQSEMLPEEVRDVAIVGSYAYVVHRSDVAIFSGGMSVLDLSTIKRPAVVGRLSGLNPFSISSDGHVAYVADRAGLLAIDVSDPARPHEVGRLDATSQPQRSPCGAVGSHALHGDHAYLANAYGLCIVDVTDPSDPRAVAGLPWGASGNNGYDVAVAAGHAFVANTEGLIVIDVSDPASPRQVAVLDALTGATEIAVALPFAYVHRHTGDDAAVDVVDISDPGMPRVVGSLPVEPLHEYIGWGDLAAAGDRVAFATGTRGLHVLDVGDPSAPAVVAAVMPAIAPDTVVEIAGDTAYVPDGSSSVQVLDLADPYLPRPRASIATMGPARVRVVEGTLYVADAPSEATRANAPAEARLRAFDVAQPSRPLELGSVRLDVTWHPVGLDVSGDRAYVAGYGELVVVDVGEPTGLRTAATIAAPPDYIYTGRVQADGNVLYASTALGYDEVHVAIDVLDVSNAAEPRRVTLMPDAGAVDDPDASFVASAGYLYARSETYPRRGGFRIIDNREPRAPVSVGHYDIGGIGDVVGFSAHVDRGRFAMIEGGQTLRILDVTDPRMPREVTLARLPSPLLSGVSYRAPFVILTGLHQGVRVGLVP